jgi:multicomponent Na+:H+ antiporter subunit F
MEMLQTVLVFILYIALLVHILLIAICTLWLAWGETIIDRLVTAELIATLMLAVMILLALIHGDRIYIDVAMGLAAMGFVAMIALAKYVADQQIF